MEVKLTEIRIAGSADIAAINIIARQVHDLHVELRPDIYVCQEEVITEEFFREVSEKGTVLVGELDGTIISYAVCFIREWNNPVQTKRKVMFVDAVGCDKKYRRCGIGTQMMEYIMDYARKENCDRLELQVMAANEVALEFYGNLKMKTKAKIMELDL